ncbi:hypothetical protein ACMD2_26173 [Ananas comosus]|uniref:Uncharacterized protein n=1 Tax=Ananas comosus TaxID=4615 RepID=A0A199V3K4_ANACO|nr:hypothetical protein ACMD2_26173 [Ananas comosus]
MICNNSVMAGKYKEGSNRSRLGSTMMRREQEARPEIPSTEEIGEHRPRIEINRSNHQMEQTNGLDVPNSSSAASCSERKRTRGKTIGLKWVKKRKEEKTKPGVDMPKDLQRAVGPEPLENGGLRGQRLRAQI